MAFILKEQKLKQGISSTFFLLAVTIFSAVRGCYPTCTLLQLKKNILTLTDLCSREKNSAIFCYVSHALDSVFNLRSLLPLNLAHAKQDEENNSIVSAEHWKQLPNYEFWKSTFEGSFPLSCNTISLFHRYLKYAVYCQCDDFFFHCQPHTFCLEISISYILSFKNQIEIKFLLGTHDFQLHPCLQTCCTLSTPAKENSNNPISLSSSSIYLLGSSIRFPHLKTLNLRKLSFLPLPHCWVCSWYKLALLQFPSISRIFPSYPKHDTSLLHKQA